MNAEQLLAHYETIADAPDATARLRRLILDLAVRGKLVPQDTNDEPASLLIRRMSDAKQRLIAAGHIGRQKALPPISTLDQAFNLPNGWCWVRLGGLTDLVTSGSRDWAKYYSKEGAIFVRMGNLSKDHYRLRLEHIQRVTPPVGGEGSRTRLEAGDILISITGDVGMLGLIPQGFGEAYINQHTAMVRPLREMKGLYLAEVFRSPFAQRQFNGPQRGIKNSFRLTDVTQFVVPLPPLSEQHRIVAKVDELMALCDQLEKSRAAREETRDRLTAASLARLNDPAPETFHTDARFALDALPSMTARPDQIKQLRQTILNLAVRGRLGQAAQGELKAVGAFRSLQNGYAFKSEWFVKKGMRLLRNANIGHGTISWEDAVFLDSERVDEFKRFLLKEGDIVLTLDRPFIVTGTKVARISAHDAPSLLLQRVGRFVETAPGLSNDYLFMWINSPDFNRQIDPGRSNGVPHISSKQVEAAKIFVPSLYEQQRIIAKVRDLMALCDRLEAGLASAETARRRLLDALLHDALQPSVDQLEAA